MRKIGVLIFLCLIFFAQLVYAQEIPIVEDLDEKVEKIEDTREKIEGLKDTDTSYLVGKWKGVFRNNSVTGTVDKGFNFLSPVFKILIKEDYSLSWRFFIIFFFWIFIFLNISNLFSKSLFEGWLGWAIGLVVTTLLAFVGTFQFTYNYFLGFVTMFEGWKKWAIIGVVILVLFLAGKFRGYFTLYLEEQKNKAEKDKEKFNRWLLNKIASIYKKDLDSYK